MAEQNGLKERIEGAGYRVIGVVGEAWLREDIDTYRKCGRYENVLAVRRDLITGDAPKKTVTYFIYATDKQDTK